MKERIVKQYICDFCGKKRISKAAMNKHEKYCTMSPNRRCRMCEQSGNLPIPIEELKAMFPAQLVSNLKADMLNHIPDYERAAVFKPYLDALHDKTEGCPACMLATIRQSGIHGFDIGFDYQEEVKKFWAIINEMNKEEQMGMVGFVG